MRTKIFKKLNSKGKKNNSKGQNKKNYNKKNKDPIEYKN